MTETLVESAVEHRSAQVADVNFPRRIVTVIAMPYEQPTQIFEHGRAFTEIVSRGAFDGVEKRGGRIKVNRDHDPSKAIGRVVAMHPSRADGLVTEILMSRSQPGEDALLDAADQILDASAGFRLLRQGADGNSGPVHPNAESWDAGRLVRRLNKLYLDHVALVSNPAYPGATVLDVRDASVRPQEAPGGEATPNRDRMALLELRAQHEALNARWLR